MKEFWIAPGRVSYKKEEIIWLIPWLPALRVGIWPPEHVESGYAGFKGAKPGHQAPFEPACRVAADVDTRLELAGEDGILLELFYTSEVSYDHLARCHKTDEFDIERRVGKALCFVSGWRMKRRRYKDYRPPRRRA